jgi:hypothetical protein
MAWTTPLTAVDGAALTAAQWNASVRDNLLETAPAKATASGRIFVSTGVNSIAQREIKQGQVLTQETTTNTSYTDLTTVGPSVTITSGTLALVSIQCQMFSSGSSNSNWSSFAISGATTVASSDQVAISCEAAAVSQAFRFGASILQTVTAGSNTYKQQYRVGGATGTFDDRNIIVMAL